MIVPRFMSLGPSLALCLALLPLAPEPAAPGSSAQDQPEGTTQTPRITRGQLQRAEVERMEKEIQGLWKVERLRLENQQFQGSEMVGYLLAAPGYVSFEFHMQNFPNDGGFDGYELLFQTGIHNYRFTPLGEMEMFGMIGTSNLNSNEADFEPPGQRRVYQIKLTGDHMTLERTESGMVLTRISRPPHTSEPK